MEVTVNIPEKALTIEAKKRYKEAYEEEEDKGYTCTVSTFEYADSDGSSLMLGLSGEGANGLYVSIEMDLKEIIEEESFWKALGNLAEKIRLRKEKEERVLRLVEIVK